MEYEEASVLIIDDDDSVRRSMARLLKSEGIGSVGARNADEGLKLLRSMRQRNPRMPAVVLLDLTLPGMTAEDFRRSQLGDPLLANVLVIVASAAADAKERANALGAIAVFHKPVDVDRFLPLIRSIVPCRLHD